MRPTRVRYSVLFLLCILAMITYMDRAANGSARTAILADLNADLPAGAAKYTDADYQWILLAFQLAYAIFEVPSGWLGDTFGPRSTLLRVVLWWSAFVALSAFAGMSLPIVGYVGFTGLIIIQFFFGVGEAGAFPNIAKSLYNWFPATARGTAKSAVWMSARCMGGLTPLLWTLLVTLGGLHWREALWLFAAVAVVWCSVFFFVFRNTPAEVKSVNAAELELIDRGRVKVAHPSGVPWGKMIRSRNLWAVCGMYVVTNFCWYFLMYNHPKAMKDAYGEWAKGSDLRECLLALLSGAPLLIGMFGCLLGGVLSDRYIRRTGDRKWGRRLFGMLGYGLAGVCYLAAAGVQNFDPANLWGYAVLLIMMGFCNDLIMAPAWAVCQDIGRDYAATVSGSMNMVGNLVGAVGGIYFTKLVMDHYGRDHVADARVACFLSFAAVYFVGVGLWLLIDASKPIVAEVEVADGRD
jgi:MFS transporter, ACS family, glucarate transporter